MARPSVLRLGRRMREGCIPALGMGVDRRAFLTFLVRLRGWARENNATPPAFPCASIAFQLPLSDYTTPHQRRHGSTQSAKTSSAGTTPSAQLTTDADELAHSPPMPVTGRQRGCQLILAVVRQVRLARALPTRCAEIWIRIRNPGPRSCLDSEMPFHFSFFVARTRN